MKNKLTIGIILIIALGALVFNHLKAIEISPQELKGLMNENLGATYLFPSGGGTGTSTNPSYGQMLVGNAGGTYILTATSSLGIVSGGGSGTVTSVDMSVPTGLTISGNPITTAGTLALGIDTGYQILTDIASSTWDAKWDALTDISLAKGNFIVGDDAGVSQATSSIFISSDGKVGFGTTSPGADLDIYNDIASSTEYIYSGGAGFGGRIIKEKEGGSGCAEQWSGSDGLEYFSDITCP